MNYHFFGDIFFPPVCVRCGDSIATGAVCDTCRSGIDIFNTLFCGTCNARLPEQKKICHKDAPYMLGAAGSYDDETLRMLIHALKFQGIKSAAIPLGEILATYAKLLRLDLAGYTITPIPLSKERTRARGFNQSTLIARQYAVTLSLPFKEHLLARVAHRKPQSETQDIFERRDNIKGCFALATGADVQNKNIVLVDDVSTSGTTLFEAARVLKLGGAKKILALVVARA
jgi:ComF family protein